MDSLRPDMLRGFPQADAKADELIQRMTAAALEASTTPQVRRAAETALREAGVRDGRNTLGVIEAVRRYMRDTDHVRYVRDPLTVEELTLPAAILAGADTDCDGGSALQAAMLMSVGVQPRFVLWGRDPRGEYDHVFVEAFDPGSGRWIESDWVAPEHLRAGLAQGRRSVFPLNPSQAGYGDAIWIRGVSGVGESGYNSATGKAMEIPGYTSPTRTDAPMGKTAEGHTESSAVLTHKDPQVESYGQAILPWDAIFNGQPPTNAPPLPPRGDEKALNDWLVKFWADNRMASATPGLVTGIFDGTGTSTAGPLWALKAAWRMISDGGQRRHWNAVTRTLARWNRQVLAAADALTNEVVLERWPDRTNVDLEAISRLIAWADPLFIAANPVHPDYARMLDEGAGGDSDGTLDKWSTEAKVAVAVGVIVVVVILLWVFLPKRKRA